MVTTMRITAELSLYPMQGDPIGKILKFIDAVQGSHRVEIAVNQMSTQIRGDLDDVMQVIASALRESFAAGGPQVLVAKFLNADLPIAEPPDLEQR
jgi:uncharacterized protein YqgV (UPF0045/DUF77 family)